MPLRNQWRSVNTDDDEEQNDPDVEGELWRSLKPWYLLATLDENKSHLNTTNRLSPHLNPHMSPLHLNPQRNLQNLNPHLRLILSVLTFAVGYALSLRISNGERERN